MRYVSKRSFQTRLLGGTAVVAVAAIIGLSGQAMADAGATTVTASGAVNATDTAGLSITANSLVAVTIDSNSGAVVLGATATTDSYTRGAAAGGTFTDTLVITNTGTNNLVTFAGNITGSAGDESLAITSTNTDLLFNGDVAIAGSGTVALVLGAGTDTITTTFDTPTNSNNAIAMTINASAANDVITLAVTNTDSANANTITFSKAIGGGSTATAIDAITLGANTTTTFSAAVRADKITVSNTNTNTFVGDIVGAIDIAAAGTISFVGNNGGALVSGAINNTTGGDGVGTLTLGDQGVDAVFGGAIGATNSLLAITATTTGQGAAALTFSGNVSATTITLTGGAVTDETIFSGDVTGAVVIGTNGLITVAADKKITGSVTTDTNGAGLVTFATTTTDTTVASSTLGASGKLLKVVTAGAATGKTATITGDVYATTIAIANTAADGTVAFGGNLTGTTINFTAAGTATIAADKVIAGNLDASGAYGTVTFAATSTNSTLVSGTTGNANALLAVNVAPASGVTATMTGLVKATTLTTSGAGTLALTGGFTGTTLKISGGGTVTSDIVITGAVDNTSGSDGRGILTMASTKGVTGIIGGTNALSVLNVNSGAGTSVFGAAVSANTVNLAGTGTATFAGDVTASSAVHFTGAGTASIAADKKIVGAVTTSADGQGTLSFATSTALTTLVSGDVGSSSAALSVVNASSNGGAFASFGGNIYSNTVNISNTAATDTVSFSGDITAATEIKFTTNGIAAFNGTAAQTITGAITTGGGNTGDISVTNAGGRVKFAGLIGVTGTRIGDITLATGTKSEFDSAVFAQVFSLTGTADVIVDATITTTGKLITKNGNTITLGSSMTNGTTVFNPADSTVAGLDQTIGAVTVKPNSTFSSGSVKLITNGAAMDATDLAAFTVSDTALVDYTLSLTNTNQDITISATKKSSSSIASTLGITTESAIAFDNANTAVATGDTTALDALNSALTTGGATATKAAETMAMQADILGAGSATAISTGGQVLGVASNRLAMMRSDTGRQYASLDETGFSSGGSALSKAGWIKPFGNWVKQGTHKGIKGFDANTYGVSGGLDTKVNDKSRLGASFTYSNSNVDGKGAGNAQTDINSYQVTAYGDYTVDKFYVEGSLGFARNTNKTSRTITVATLNRTAKGDYDSNQYMASLSGGMPINLKGSTFFTPTAGVSWTHVKSDNYTETGAGNLNLQVNQKNVDALILGVGGKLHSNIKYKKGTLVPVVSAGLSYDASGDEAIATSTYTGGGASFKTTGAKVEQLGANVGAGLTYDDGAWSVSGNYNLDLKQDYRSHSATVEARWKF